MFKSQIIYPPHLFCTSLLQATTWHIIIIIIPRSSKMPKNSKQSFWWLSHPRHPPTMTSAHRLSRAATHDLAKQPWIVNKEAKLFFVFWNRIFSKMNSFETRASISRGIIIEPTVPPWSVWHHTTLQSGSQIPFTNSTRL